MIEWTATREVRVMPKKRYRPEEILQHLRTVELVPIDFNSLGVWIELKILRVSQGR